MYFGADCVDAVSLNTNCISQPGYLGSIKRKLMEKYASELQYLSKEPEFLIARNDASQQRA